ncbi:hypothetical protein E4T56_gene5874 [Termitomyces sp. T112]|nr:hypothetical protein E4T56_gene5874 [Termitomyces sp. T112]
MESWCILLHIAAAEGWDAAQINVKTAFLYGILPEDEVQYMEQPEGFEEGGKEDLVSHARVKHFNIKYHFIRERAQMGEILIKYVNH